MCEIFFVKPIYKGFNYLIDVCFFKLEILETCCTLVKI